MKKKFQYTCLLALIISLASCDKDNFDEPSSTLQGKFHYKGEAIQVEYDRVPLQLYQYGFGKVGAIDFRLTPEGTYSALLFDGQYKFIVPNGQGPFKWNKTAAGNPDSVTIDLSGSKVLDFEVTPYYMVRNPQFSVAAGKVTATCKMEKIVTDATGKDIEQVILYINKTNFVSGDFNVATTSIAGSAIVDPNNISLTVTIPTIVPTQKYVFARIGLKIAGVEDRIFSPVQKLTF